MRIDPDPGGCELQLLGQYLACQLDTVLLTSDGLSGEELIRKLLPSDPTLGGLLCHLALVEGCWLEVRSLGAPERDPTPLRSASKGSGCSLVWSFRQAGHQVDGRRDDDHPQRKGQPRVAQGHPSDLLGFDV